jgi:hypothetical protein
VGGYGGNEPIGELGAARGFAAGSDIVGHEFSDGLLLFDVRETNFMADDRRRKMVNGVFLPLRTRKEH